MAACESVKTVIISSHLQRRGRCAARSNALTIAAPSVLCGISRHASRAGLSPKPPSTRMPRCLVGSRRPIRPVPGEVWMVYRPSIRNVQLKKCRVTGCVGFCLSIMISGVVLWFPITTTLAALMMGLSPRRNIARGSASRAPMRVRMRMRSSTRRRLHTKYLDGDCDSLTVDFGKFSKSKNRCAPAATPRRLPLRSTPLQVQCSCLSGVLE